MKTQSSPLISLTFFLILFSSVSWGASASSPDSFLQCLSHHSSNSISHLLHTPRNSSYASVLDASLQNPRFSSLATPKPLLILTPLHESQIQAAIICSRKHRLQIRVRSGGHDFEGLSYVAQLPYIIIDLINLRSVSVDTKSKTAWLQTGVALGELYYKIAEKSKTLAFPGGICPTVGSGGHISGGGYGMLMRKYGLAADNVIDARVVDVNGKILDRRSMGEDLFWALRGGGGASFGVVVAWKINLVPVPPTVTVFRVHRNLEQNATKLVHKWQYVANKLDKDLFIRVLIRRVNSTTLKGKQTIEASFNSLFLGGAEKLVSLMQESFPELGLVREDCTEMSWIESVLYQAEFPSGTSLEALLDRSLFNKVYFKGKLDYVQEPIPEFGLEGIWERLFEDEAKVAQLVLTPYGGKMSEIQESAIPFPHRAGNLYQLLNLVSWEDEDNNESKKFIDWNKRLSNYVTPFVSKYPRATYINYKDLDLGTNNIVGRTSYKQASVWGVKYFKNNFKRLVQVKTKVDPTNFFQNEQSIPSLISRKN